LAHQVEVRGCEVAGKVTRMRLVEGVITIEGVMLMCGWIDSPRRGADVFAPFVHILIEGIVSVRIDIAVVRHVLTAVCVRSRFDCG
jgi:hypothetical protein